MKARILSSVSRRGFFSAMLLATIVGFGVKAHGQQSGELVTDPVTGDAYRKKITMVETPVIEEKLETRTETILQPKTLVVSKPETRTVYTPVVEYQWEPRLHGRWNPLQRPTVQYHHVARTTWQARNEVVERKELKTEWVAVNRTVEVPQRRLVRTERKEQVQYEYVGKVAPQSSAVGVSDAVAARLRPLSAGTRIEPSNRSQIASLPSYQSPRIAATTVGRMDSDPPRRNPGQTGMRATDLYPTSAPVVHGQALPASSNGTGIATLPSLPLMR